MPYQARWVGDGSRFKIGVWSRQTGKSFSTAAEATTDALTDPGTTWVPFRISRVGSDGRARKVRAMRGASDAGGREFCRRALWESIVDCGPVVDLFENPHPTMNRTLFWEQLVSWDALRGEFFIVPLDGEDRPVDLSERAPVVSRMLTLDTGMFWHMVNGFKLEAWRYTGSPLLSPLPSEVLLPSEVVHCRNVNPYLFWRGMSPLLVAMLPASADYAAEMFQKGLLMNNADTGIIATTDQALRVKGVFNNLTDAEAVRVARTETNLAFNAARHEALGDAGIEYKAWLSSHGPNVRAGHAGAEEAYIDNPIPLDEPFIVDLDGDAEQMMYPGDDSLGASPGNIINCQCVQLAAMKEGEDETHESYRIYGVGVVRFEKAESRKQPSEVAGRLHGPRKAEIGHCCGK